ncbi:redoxin domain-containing protein, partial [Saccharothrix sp. MB29]|nr:redoxin domain-containing protein [Saccharothrix sp. MB29]
DTPFSLKAWSAEQGYGFPLLSDFWPHGEVARAYGVFDEKSGMAVRGTFLVDVAGVVRYAEVNGADAAERERVEDQQDVLRPAERRERHPLPVLV